MLGVFKGIGSNETAISLNEGESSVYVVADNRKCYSRIIVYLKDDVVEIVLERKPDKYVE